jgi:fructokinase
MPEIYTIGETVLDIIFKNEQPVAAKPGGSMLNTSVSLGRLGLPVHIISEYGNDGLGNLIHGFLHENNIKTGYVHRYNNGKTALAMAFLDEKNNATYDFYKHYPSKRLDIVIPPISQEDYVLFGSFFGISAEIRPALKAILQKAQEQGTIIYYDPNFRKAHVHELEQLKPLIIENMQMASIVRCSNEDMALIAGVETPERAYQFISSYCPNMIYTDSAKGVYVYTPYVTACFPVRNIIPLSTIGAGDTFNAGIVYGLWKNNIYHSMIHEIHEEMWNKITEIAVSFATEVCLSYENYISINYANDFNNKR